jgi:hypothetical protein
MPPPSFDAIEATYNKMGGPLPLDPKAREKERAVRRLRRNFATADAFVAAMEAEARRRSLHVETWALNPYAFPDMATVRAVERYNRASSVARAIVAASAPPPRSPGSKGAVLCTATTRAGARCRNKPSAGSGFCWRHVAQKARRR